MQLNNFAVYDFETDGKDPETCNPVQIACKMVDPYNLKEINNSDFCSFIRPDDIDKPEYFTDDIVKTITWHAKIRECSSEEIIDLWKKAPPEKIVWKNFEQHVNKYNKKKTNWFAPYSAGYNIDGFDNIITDRLNAKYKVTKFFNHKTMDVMKLIMPFVMWDSSLKSISMDSMREYYGLCTENAHDAMKDVDDTADIMCRHLKFLKNTFDKTNYRGCMKEKN